MSMDRLREFLPALLIVGKALFVAMFSMTAAVLLTWADRRQGSMIQDRVGPNRAVIFLPGKFAAVMALLPALAIAGAAGWWLVLARREAPTPTEALVFSQLAILSVWATAAGIAGRVRSLGVASSIDLLFQQIQPRSAAAAGLVAHLISLFAFLGLRGSEYAVTLTRLGAGSGPAILAVAVLGGAFYTAMNCAREKQVGLRLAGIMHPVADGLKSIFKEDFIPPTADKLLHAIAPIISFFPVLVLLAVVPFGAPLCLGVPGDWSTLFGPATAVCTGQTLSLQVLDVDSGLLFYLALAGLGIIGAVVGGWASNNKYSLLGAIRAASQMVSYEVTLGLTLVGALMIYGTLRVDLMVAWQAANSWGIFVQPLGFILFFAAAIAESKRIPFDIPEGESEIVAGYFTEYSGMKFAMFFFAEYVTVVTSSALISALFLGGWHLPFFDASGLRVTLGQEVLFAQPLPHLVVVLLGVLAFIGKTLLLCWLQLLIRWTLPRFRYDQLMKLSWRVLLPASLGNVMITGLLVLVAAEGGASMERGLAYAADVTELVVVGASLWATVAMVRLIFEPTRYQAMLASTSAQFAKAMGGTRTRRMGA